MPGWDDAEYVKVTERGQELRREGQSPIPHPLSLLGPLTNEGRNEGKTWCSVLLCILGERDMRSGSGEKTSNDQCSGEEGCLDMNTDTY